MGDELDKVSGGGESIEEAVPTSPGASGEGTTQDTPEIPGDIKAMIAAEVAKVRAEFEGPGGRIAQIQSKKDKEVAEVQKQLKELKRAQLAQAQEDFKQAQGLMQTDPRKAAQMMQALYESQAQAAMMENQTQEMADWMERVMVGMGLSTEDGETAAFAREWFEKLVDDPDLTHDFHQAAAVRLGEIKDKEIKARDSELKQLKDSVPDMVKAEVTRLLAESGLSPALTGDGTPTKKKENWRSKGPQSLINEGLAERRGA